MTEQTLPGRVAPGDRTVEMVQEDVTLTTFMTWQKECRLEILETERVHGAFPFILAACRDRHVDTAAWGFHQDQVSKHYPALDVAIRGLTELGFIVSHEKKWRSRFCLNTWNPRIPADLEKNPEFAVVCEAAKIAAEAYRNKSQWEHVVPAS